MEIMPVFTRKPLFAYKVAAAGMLGVALLSFFVWQHHLFQSGINPDMRPLFMLTTELISIPTGFLYLVTWARCGRRRSASTPRCSLPGDALQLPDRRGHRRLPLRRPGERHRPRQLLRAGPLPLHDHGRADLRLLRRLVLLVAEDDRQDPEPQAQQVALLDVLHLLQPDLLPALPGRSARPAPAGVRVRAEPADAERHLVHQRLLARRILLPLHHQLRLVDVPDPARGPAQPVELARPRVADADPGALVQLRAHSRSC